jgi:DNA-binding IclR family transcriptional regulator
VYNHEGAVVAAVSVGGPSIRLTDTRRAQLVKLVKAAAARISERLGYREH